MKKKWIRDAINFGSKSKAKKIMQLSAFFLLLSLSNVFAVTDYPQQTLLTLKLTNVRIVNVLDELEKQSEFQFIFNQKLIDVERKVNVDYNKKTIDYILKDLFAGTDVHHQINDRKVVLTTEKYQSNTLPNESKKGSVTGKVTDSSGEPLIGVSVIVKGTANGTVTNVDGFYQINDVSTSNILLFSYVGMKMQEVSIGNRTSINVLMNEDAIGIQEVVAIGYGTVRKSDLTGSVTRVNASQLQELPSVSIIESIRGTVPGLNVGAINSPGANPSLSIRGQNSLSGNTEDSAPLVVVDGSIYRGSIIDINPDDIESIDILKDASSAAIYGSQASNGVIILTTKKGVDLSKPIITYSGSYSYETPSNTRRPMKSAELDGFFRDANWMNSRLSPDYLNVDPDFNLTQYLKSNDIVQGYNNGIDEDWWGGLTRNGAINNQNISVRGKSKEMGYFVSGGYTNQKGFMINNDYSRYNMRMNLDLTINKWLKLGVESFITSSDYSGKSPDIENAFMMQPWAPIRDEQGELVLFPEGTMLNPYAELNVKDSEKRLTLSGNIFAEIKLPIKGLNYKINFSQNYQSYNHDQYNPYGANLTGSAFKNSSLGYDWSVDNLLSYVKTFNDIHSINATFVYGVEKRIGSETNVSAQKFENGILGYNKLEAADPTLNVLNSGAWQETSLYTMLRGIYNLKNKYLITGTLRRDGFSGFGTNNKIAIFPSIALGWVASEELLLKDNVNWLDYLKFRGTYGSTGRRAVNRYQTLAQLNSGPSYIFGDGGTTTNGQWITSMANNELGWETTTGINIGIDYAILNSRIRGNVEYYNNNTSDILYNIQLPQMTGFTSIATNIGKVHNHGVEFSLIGVPVKTRDFFWESTLNFSSNRNKIVSILGFDNNNDGKEDDLVSNQLFIGEPQKVIYDYQIIGMWQFADKDAGTIPSGFYPGTYMIADLNGPDGVPDGAYSATYDKKILGYKDPAYRFSWANRINYKQFSLYMVVNSIQGGKNYYMGDDSPQSTLWAKVEQLRYLNVPSGAWDYWMPENPNAYYRRLDTGAAYDPRRYSQRNFIRLQDLSISYSFDKKLINKLDISALKVYVSGKNLLTITDWKGLDPETGQGFAPGLPVMRNYTFGINVEL